MSESDSKDSQARLFTPLEDGVFLLRSFEGTEQISHPFKFTLNLYCPNKKKAQVEFDKLLGKEFTVECDIYSREKEKRTGEHRYFTGICFELIEGLQDYEFTSYTAEIVPKVQLLSLQDRSRIFQQKTVLDVLKEVLPKSGVEYQVDGHFDKREYCVQYRESDFDFACRLMEEEGIFYFFKHEKSGHTMVLANSPLKHPKVLDPYLVGLDPTEGGIRRAAHVSAWSKSQRLRSGKYALWDHSFELPTANLEATKTTQDSAKVGKVSHKLIVGGNDELELYDYPGGYAKRVDGISKSGGEQPSELQTVHSDNQRTVKIRMEAETSQAIFIHATSNCIHFTSGYKFSVEESDASKGFKGDGEYVLTEIQHTLELAVGYRAGEKEKFSYSNAFVCIPQPINYRPQRTTRRPAVMGVQSATVVGPSGEEIFTDKYGRVKVQFRWDRDGKKDANSSCWLRVASSWAGKQWGMVNIPRIGQEVIVDFLEGDPDAPIIIGSVYNPDTMPPYGLPDNKTQSGIKSRSSKEGTPDNFNEVRFEDSKDKEEIYVHAEKDFTRVVENNDSHKIGFDKKDPGDQTVEVYNNQKVTIGDPSCKDGSQTVEIYKDRTATVKMGDDSLTLKMGNQSVDVKMGNQTTKLDLGKSSTEAMQSIELKVGQSSIKIDQMGVTIKGMMISIDGQVQTDVKGVMTQVTGSAMLKLGGGITMIG